MIEFKSDCGHTVRARDEDAGKKVRCSYCGHETEVPSGDDRDLDFIFSDMDKSGSHAGIPAVGAAGRGPFSRKPRFRDSRPIDVALKLVYVAIIISVIAVVTNAWILPYFDDLASDRLSRRSAEADDQPSNPPPAPPRPRNAGLIQLQGSGGLYVASFPQGAAAFCVEESVFRPGARVSDASNCQRVRTDAALAVSDSAYTVEVVIPWNDPALTRYPDYNGEFRRKLENAAGRAERDALARSYFLPDGADDVFVSETNDQIYIVRQFHHVVVRQDRWVAIHALFVPAGLSVGDVVTRYLPSLEQYSFNEEHVLAELSYYNVAPSDRLFVIDALKRIGVLPYVTQDPQTGVQRTRLFKIGLEDGMFAAPVLTQAQP